MTDGNGQTTIGSSLPRLHALSQVVSRGIRGLAEITGTPSFAASLAAARAAEVEEPGAAPRPAPNELGGGRHSGDPSSPVSPVSARRSTDRVAGVPVLPGSALPPYPIVSAQSSSFSALPSAAYAAPDQSAPTASSVVSPSLTAAARSTPLLAGIPASAEGAAVPGLALREYPKPSRGDRSGVLTWASETPPTGKDLDRLVADARQRRVGWVTFSADPARRDEYGELADRLTRAGIQPIARIQDPAGDLPTRDVSALVKELRGHGVHYFQLFDGANVADETPDYRVDVQDYAQRWLAAANAVTAGGGLPGVGALDPDGDYDALGFMRQFLSAVAARGGTDVLGQSWLAMRGETPGATATRADVGDLAGRAEWFDRVSRQALGRSLPILATLDPAGASATPTAAPNASDPSAFATQSERAIRAAQRTLPALFAASRGTVEAGRV